MKFFLHGEGIFNFREHAVFSAKNQHHVDVALVPHLYNHPARTLISSNTKYHILAVIPNAIDHKSRDTRMKRVTDALRTLKEWQNRSIQFLIFAPGTSHLNLLGTELCTELSHRPNVKIVDIDPWMRGLKSNAKFARLYDNVLIVPYIIRRNLFTNKIISRNISSMFHGDTGRYDGGRRGAVRDILAHLPASEFQSTFSVRNNSTMKYNMYARTIQSMHMSKTCMCPSGDTPTTRRLYESLASGCVPIRIDNIQDHNLPFPKLIDWKHLTFKLYPAKMSLAQRHQKPDDDIMALRSREAKYVMDHFVQNSNLNSMRINGIRSAAEFMNPYRPTKFIDAILLHWFP